MSRYTYFNSNVVGVLGDTDLLRVEDKLDVWGLHLSVKGGNTGLDCWRGEGEDRKNKVGPEIAQEVKVSDANAQGTHYS